MPKSDKFNFLFQTKVLALLIKDAEFLSKYGAIVQPNYFSDVHHQQLCDMVNSYWQEYESPPTAEVLVEEIEKIPDRDKRVMLASSLEEVLNSEDSDAAYYEDLVTDFCKRQAILVALRESAGYLREGDLDAVVPTVEKALTVGESMSADSLGIQYWDDWDHVDLQRAVPKIPTMLGEVGSGGIDDVLHGGLEQGNVGMVMIPVGRGKSAFLVNVAGNAALQGFNVAYISLELHERVVAKRFNIFFTGIPSPEIEQMKGEEVRQRIKDHYGDWKFGNMLIKTFPMKSASVRQIESHLKLVKSKCGWYPDIVCIDYLDIVKPPYRTKEKHEQLEDVAEEMKAFAQRNEIPVWTASQVNRGGATRKIIRNEDSSASYAKTFSLDVIFTSAPTADEETDERKAVLFCSKNRQGRDQMTLDFELDFDSMRFVFRPRAERAGGAAQAYKNFMQLRNKK